MREIKTNDIVKLNFKGKNITGIVKWTYKTMAKVRVLKDGKLVWHEYIKVKDLILIDEGENYEQGYFNRKIN